MARRDRLGLILPGNRLGVLVTLPLVFPPAAEHRETDDDRAGQAGGRPAVLRQLPAPC
jgi:hypothetical protein